MGKFERHDADVFLCPSNPLETFNNTDSGVITSLTAAQVLPYSLVTEEFPVIKPKRQDEEAHGVGGGRNPSAILEKQYEIGAGTIPNKTIFGLMIPKIGGDVTPSHTAAEVTTVTAVADAGSNLNNKYFEFDVMLAAGTIKKYFAWMNVGGAGAEPTPAPVAYGDARTPVPVAFAADADAPTVAAAVQSAITALTDVTAVETTFPEFTITNDQDGAVDDTHDGAAPTAFTFVTSTNGRTKIEIVFHESTIEGQNFGFHVQRMLADQDRIMDIFGVTIGVYEMTCEEDGVAEESIDYTIASFKTSATDIDKMRGPNGVLWTKGRTPFLGAKKNYGWHSFNKNFTFTCGDELLCTKRAFSVRIENELQHNYDGGGEFASDVDFGLRHIEIGIDAKIEDVTILELADKHVNDYANDIVLQIKGIRGADTNDYIMWDFSKLRMLPIDEAIAAPADWMEKYNIKMKLAPDCVAKCTIEGYLSYEYYQGKDWI
ncbi:MAG: major tail protein [Thorarchaeia virus VerdaV2]|uniref:Major tail protein n=1 Tax=Thorarchaeia virus VerdaV2 TaxID=3070171 RepID=A0AA35GAI0_9CAUD|nr:MAG: major tail protein [Thorarchaeia virus VerdaV2]BDI54903.1 MAG: major tail protein [Thorarchaeia virus VerdaV2]